MHVSYSNYSVYMSVFMSTYCFPGHISSALWSRLTRFAVQVALVKTICQLISRSL